VKDGVRFHNCTRTELESGVNEAGEGFIKVRHTSKAAVLLGQMTPDDLRAHGQACFEAAEAADQDAAVLRTLRKMELPDAVAGIVITELRATRKADGP